MRGPIDHGWYGYLSCENIDQVAAFLEAACADTRLSVISVAPRQEAAPADLGIDGGPLPLPLVDANVGHLEVTVEREQHETALVVGFNGRHRRFTTSLTNEHPATLRNGVHVSFFERPFLRLDDHHDGFEHGLVIVPHDRREDYRWPPRPVCNAAPPVPETWAGILTVENAAAVLERMRAFLDGRYYTFTAVNAAGRRYPSQVEVSQCLEHRNRDTGTAFALFTGTSPRPYAHITVCDTSGQWSIASYRSQHEGDDQTFAAAYVAFTPTHMRISRRNEPGDLMHWIFAVEKD